MTKKETKEPAKKKQDGNSLISTISVIGLPQDFVDEKPVEERLYHLDGTEDET